MLSLESALRAGADGAVLEAYVSIFDASKRDAKGLGSAALRVWRLPDGAKADLDAHLAAALAERPLVLPRGPDDTLIEQARRKHAARART